MNDDKLVVGHCQPLDFGRRSSAPINFDPAARQLGPIRLDPTAPAPRPPWPEDAAFTFGQAVDRRGAARGIDPRAKIAGWARRDDGRLAYVVEHALGEGRCAVIHERDLEPRKPPEIPSE